MKVFDKLKSSVRKGARWVSSLGSVIGDLAIMVWMATELWDATSARKGRMLLLGIAFLGWDALHKFTKPKRFKPYSKWVWPAFALAMACFWWFGETVIKNNRKEPNLTVILDSVDGHDVNISLTNDFLFTHLAESKNVLLIPVAPGDSNIILCFSFTNGPVGIASDVEVSLLSSSKLNCIQNDSWQPPTPFGADNIVNHWETFCQRPLYPLDRQRLGPLAIPAINRTLDSMKQLQYPVLLAVSANREQRAFVMMSFRLMFVPSTNFSLTGIYRPMNNEPISLTNGLGGAIFLTNNTFWWQNVTTNSN